MLAQRRRNFEMPRCRVWLRGRRDRFVYSHGNCEATLHYCLVVYVCHLYLGICEARRLQMVPILCYKVVPQFVKSRVIIVIIVITPITIGFIRFYADISIVALGLQTN